MENWHPFLLFLLLVLINVIIYSGQQCVQTVIVFKWKLGRKFSFFCSFCYCYCWMFCPFRKQIKNTESLTPQNDKKKVSLIIQNFNELLCSLCYYLILQNPDKNKTWQSVSRVCTSPVHKLSMVSSQKKC